MSSAPTPNEPPTPLDARAVLHLGSGRTYMPAAVNVDRVGDAHPDVTHDLDVRPWPFPDDRFEEVLAFDVVEHLADVVATMDEIHRVSRSRARVRITVPHFSCVNAFADVTHRHVFSVSSFDYLAGDGHPGLHSVGRFRRRRAEIVFSPTLVNKVVWRLARRFPAEYERRWAWMFPAWFLSFDLDVVK